MFAFDSEPKYRVGDKLRSKSTGNICRITKGPWKDLNSGDHKYNVISDDGYMVFGVSEDDITASYIFQLELTLPPSSPLKDPGCDIVRNTVLFKDFLYCKTHDDEAEHTLYCRKVK